MDELVRIFTDGACKGNPGSGGWAAVICKHDNVDIIGGHCLNTTNNRMELLAVVNGLTKVLKCGATNVSVLSDSAYVVNAINKKWIHSWSKNGWMKSNNEPVKNSDLWKSLFSTMQLFESITFTKVKGHSGHKFNELADKHAKLMSNME